MPIDFVASQIERLCVGLYSLFILWRTIQILRSGLLPLLRKPSIGQIRGQLFIGLSWPILIAYVVHSLP